jgi:hypothetical protein
LQNALREARAGRSSRINASGVDPTALARAANATRACGDGTDASRGDGGRGDGGMRKVYAESLYNDASATLHDLREAVTTLEETSQTARRVLGGAHPVAAAIEDHRRDARAALRAREASA